MPRGDKSKYTDKQKRKAEHIAEGYEGRGVPEGEAEARAWATVNKESGGGNQSGSGRGKPDAGVGAAADVGGRAVRRGRATDGARVAGLDQAQPAADEPARALGRILRHNVAIGARGGSR